MTHVECKTDRRASMGYEKSSSVDACNTQATVATKNSSRVGAEEVKFWIEAYASGVKALNWR